LDVSPDATSEKQVLQAACHLGGGVIGNPRKDVAYNAEDRIWYVSNGGALSFFDVVNRGISDIQGVEWGDTPVFLHH